jgi:hypothetical protein
MQTSLSQNRHLILLTLFLALLFTLFYIYQPVDHSASSLINKESSTKKLNEGKEVVNPVKAATKKPKKIWSVCDKVDVSWL